MDGLRPGCDEARVRAEMGVAEGVGESGSCGGEDSVGEDEVVEGGADILFRRWCIVPIAIEGLISGCALGTLKDSPRDREMNWVGGEPGLDIVVLLTERNGCAAVGDGRGGNGCESRLIVWGVSGLRARDEMNSDFSSHGVSSSGVGPSSLKPSSDTAVSLVPEPVRL